MRKSVLHVSASVLHVSALYIAKCCSQSQQAYLERVDRAVLGGES